MHRYSVDKDNYEKIWYILIFISAIFDVIVNTWIIPFMQDLIPNPILSGLLSSFIISLLCFYGIFYAFDKWLWKAPIIGMWVDCPNISGKWEGEINNDKGYNIKVDVEIIQTWTKIIMNLYTPTARSRTTTLTFFTQNSSNPSLTYVYYNIAKNSDILQSHGGTGHLIFYKENQVLEGNYYTDEKRDNHGTIKLIKNS
ncbi:hypothetical protein [uncultured Methanobrevibacter sp.]|uniref:Cap15 family cyclic dinucleotide receptor domain-containing protein n=1 Tax=uncultured Methanobrevibacter sp. TaxID=253161 RepID=UPI002600F5BE|nr:hypothetical protein [uncultured Methanobrevibacter sp.]